MTKHFLDHELGCKCGCKKLEMDVLFMEMLEELRECFSKPMQLSSAFRCAAHNVAVSSTGFFGPHTTGQAVDVLVSGEDALLLVGLALKTGFTGIGVKQRGSHRSRFIHLDNLSAPDFLRPWIWSY